MSIQIRRAYDPPGRGEGHRVLVDRVWPRGIRKDELAVDEWLRDLAPSTPLRKWFGHDPARWEEFQRRYYAELAEKSDAIRDLLSRVRKGRVTLVYSARDRAHNQAIVLAAFLSARAAGRRLRVQKPEPNA